ncbi:hypothetical protein [Kingella potus]|nr:hypothetical protein [Kingella potus]UOP00288.1 hypothetical protein LVJ84_10295 [Kingella potus]
MAKPKPQNAFSDGLIFSIRQTPKPAKPRAPLGRHTLPNGQTVMPNLP